MLALVEVDAPVRTQLLGLSFTPPIASLPASGDICTVTHLPPMFLHVPRRPP